MHPVITWNKDCGFWTPYWRRSWRQNKRKKTFEWYPRLVIRNQPVHSVNRNPRNMNRYLSLITQRMLISVFFKTLYYSTRLNDDSEKKQPRHFSFSPIVFVSPPSIPECLGIEVAQQMWSKISFSKENDDIQCMWCVYNWPTKVILQQIGGDKILHIWATSITILW